MKIRRSCNLAKLYAGPHHPILANSPELLFLQAVCSGLYDDAVSLFREKKMFGDALPVVDSPYGRYTGLCEIREFAQNWLGTFNASTASVVPVIQTRANGRSVSEVVVNFVVDGEIEQVPMFVVGDLRTADSLEEIRIYCYYKYVPGLTPYRRPMFESSHKEAGDPELLSGAVKEYYTALHQMPNADVDRILGVMGKNCVFGGYGFLEGTEQEAATPEELRAQFEHISSYMPSCVAIRFEKITDDNKTCVIEWVHVISEKGQKELSRIGMSGIAAYERDDEGLICAFRICDYAFQEPFIDWSKVPVSKESAMNFNLVKEFPSTVGQKSLNK